jgi:hypothetical protein
LCTEIIFFSDFREGWYKSGVSPIAGMPPGHAYVLVYGLIGGLAFWSLMFMRGWHFQVKSQPFSFISL